MPEPRPDVDPQALLDAWEAQEIDDEAAAPLLVAALIEARAALAEATRQRDENRHQLTLANIYLSRGCPQGIRAGIAAHLRATAAQEDTDD